jgi:ADP-ribose pyrophosphatase
VIHYPSRFTHHVSLMPMSHELIKREYVHRGRILDLSRSRFMSEAKGEVEIEIVHHNGGAGTLPLFEDGTIALVKQWRYPLGRYSLEIAAGRIEPGDTPEETAARELEEELGYRAGELRKIGEFFVAPGYCEERLYVYVATGLEPSRQKLDEDEEIEVVRMPFAEAVRRVHSGEIDDAKSIITILLADSLVRVA